MATEIDSFEAERDVEVTGVGSRTGNEDLGDCVGHVEMGRMYKQVTMV